MSDKAMKKSLSYGHCKRMFRDFRYTSLHLKIFLCKSSLFTTCVLLICIFFAGHESSYIKYSLYDHYLFLCWSIWFSVYFEEVKEALLILTIPRL